VKVSPYTRHGICLTANTSPKRLATTNQQLVPDQVSHAVIDHLEPIKIHKENRKQLISVTLRTFD